MQRFKDILCVATSGSIDHVALERAVALADNNRARLTVVEVVNEIPRNTKLIAHAQSLDELQAKIVAGHRQGLEKLVAPWRGNIEIQTKVLIGIPFLEIIREVIHNGHDLVVKIADSGGLLDRVFGSNDMHLLRKCPCPVWLIKPQSSKVFQKIVATVDVGDYYQPEGLNIRHLLNLQILEMASLLALSEVAELHVVYVWEAFDVINPIRKAIIDTSEDIVFAHLEEEEQRYKQNLNKLMDELNGKLGWNAIEYTKPQIHLLKGYPHKEIPVLAKEIRADLVVMGTVARTGISGFFMGNTAETILNQLNCSVLAVKPHGFVTPVS